MGWLNDCSSLQTTAPFLSSFSSHIMLFYRYLTFATCGCWCMFPCKVCMTGKGATVSFMSSRLPLPGLGASILAPWGTDHFGTWGTPWRTMGAAGWTRTSLETNEQFRKLKTNSLKLDSVMILGPHFESLLGTEAWKFNFVPGLFPGHFVNRFVDRNRYCKKNIPHNLFLWWFPDFMFGVF